MKRLMTTITIALLSFIGTGNAQLIRNYGIKVAFTSATQSINYLTPGVSGQWHSNKTSPESGINIAVFAEWFNFPFLSFVSQIEYDHRGATVDYYRDGEPSSTRGRLEYLSVPIMAKMTIPAGQISPYLIAGPRADFLVGYKDLQFEPDPFPVYGDFKNAMIGWSMGVGLETDFILPVDLTAELRYNLDFLNSYNDGNVRIRNSAVDFWVGFGL